MQGSRPNIRAFTSRYKYRMRILENEVEIAEAFDHNDTSIKPNLIKYQCIWDTGATGSVITTKVVNNLGLRPIGKTICQTVGGQKEQNVYLVAIMLPNGVGFPSIPVTEGEIGNYDVLIGMDIIGVGDFAVTNEGGKTVLSYQLPSTETIDFVEQLKKSYPPLPTPDEKRKARNRRKRDKRKKK